MALLSPCFWPEVRRGGERFTRELADGLLARGHRPRLITGHPGRPRRTVEDGLPILRLPRLPHGPLLRRRYEPYVTHLPLSYAALRAREFDLAHAVYPTDALVAGRWRARTGRPAILSYLGIPRPGWLAQRRRGEVLRKALRECDAVVALSGYAAEQFERALGYRARVIAPGVDLDAFRPQAPRAELPTILCSAAADEPRKHVALLVQAFAIVRDELPDARLVLSRPRDAAGARRAGVPLQAPGLEWADLDDRAALAGAYAAAWVAVLPAADEAFGLVLAEAMACGTPVVGYRDGAIPELIDRPGIGLLFERLSPAALARTLLGALELERGAGDVGALPRARRRALERSLRRQLPGALPGAGRGLIVGVAVDQVLLLGSVAALAGGGWRLAGAVLPSGLPRALAAAALACSAAVVSAIALGLVGLGASPVALPAAAAAAWLAARALVEVRGPPVRAQLAGWWSRLRSIERLACAALAGAAVAYAIWVLRNPVIGGDALSDHLALPVDWVHNGRPGSIVSVNDGLSFANFPVTHEVLVTWVVGIARTLVAAMLVTPATLVLLGASVIAGLTSLGVAPPLRRLAAAVVTTLPIVVVQLPGQNTDLPEMAWLACTAALVAAAGRRASLLAPAVLAAALAIGTKTTAAPLAALVVLVGVWRARGDLRAGAGPLAAALAVGTLTGGLWYLRDLIDHGWPFWPLSSAPWGDPVPAPLRAVSASLLAHLGATLHGRAGDYERVLAGGVAVLAGALLSPAWARSRIARWAAVAVLASLALWAAEPYTGDATSTALALGATRYLLPVLLAATVTVALAGLGRAGPSLVVLALALSFNLDRDAVLRFPAAPAAGTLLLAGAIGGAVGLAVERLAPAAPRVSAGLKGALAPILVGAVLAGLILPVGRYMQDHAGAGLFDAGLVRWLDSRSAFERGRAPVLVGPVDVAVLTGTRLAHPVSMLAQTVACPALARRRRGSWIVMEVDASAAAYSRRWLGCLQGQRPEYDDGSFVVYAPGPAQPS